MKNEITSRENPVVKQTALLLKDAAERRRQGLFVAEGRVVLAEAAASNAQIDKVFCLDESEIEGIELPRGAQVYTVSRPVLEKLSGVKSPAGVVFTCRVPENGSIRGRRILAVEDLSDPGNMGTIIRTAEAFGMDTVALVGSCVDVFSPKTVRATMGAVLRVNICRTELDDLVARVHDLGLPVYAASLTPDSVAISSVDMSKAAVIIGNEARGLSQQALDKCDKHVIIPISGIQSLNAAVAASVFMYEMSRHAGC